MSEDLHRYELYSSLFFRIHSTTSFQGRDYHSDIVLQEESNTDSWGHVNDKYVCIRNCINYPQCPVNNILEHNVIILCIRLISSMYIAIE